MAGTYLEVYEEEFERLTDALRRLRYASNAEAVFLIDKNGQQIASAGEVENFDSTSLASLTAGNVAATDGLVTDGSWSRDPAGVELSYGGASLACPAIVAHVTNNTCL